MKFYVTTAIDYVNAKPHIGHALEKVEADVLARYHRAKGDEVFFLTGTDEYGLKNFRTAAAANQNVKQFVAEMAEWFKNLKAVLNLSWDDFIRTSDRVEHRLGAQKLWSKLRAAGDLYKKKYQGLCCVGCETFITEKELVEGKCSIHQQEPEKMEQENWFFRLSKYQQEIESKLKSGELRIVPETRRNEALAFVESGLDDVSFSRPKIDLPWGVPVPDDPDQVMYVWCDALSSYITAVGYADETEQFRRLWPANLHVIGKDIVRFHAAIWPGMLLSAGLPLPKAIFVHGFITVEGQKISKTLGNIIDPTELVQKYGTDPVRYYLLREIPSYGDGDFSAARFEERYNADLAKGLGNLVARVVALGERVSPLEFNFGEDIDLGVKEVTSEVYREYEKEMSAIRLNEALAGVWSLIARADRYVDEKKPWTIKDAAGFKRAMANLGYLVGVVLNLVEPFLPQTAERIRKQIWFGDFSADGLAAINFKKGENLFPRLN